MSYQQIHLKVRYELGHSYDRSFVPTTLHCVQCGQREVWVENNEGDYYVGPSHYCKACGSEFTMQEGYDEPARKNWQRMQIVAALRGEPQPERPA